MLPLDIGDLLDRGRWTPFQRRILALSATCVLVDGFDSQLIGYAIPVLIRDWGVSRADFAPVVAAGLVGMSVGSAVAGAVGDRLGRRRALIGSVLLFALATGSIGFAGSLFWIGLLRFVAGLGIGGAIPSATTLSAEFTPARWRTVAITSTIVCVPLGGMLAGVFSSYVLPAFGWKLLFWLGGALPLALCLVLAVALPESPRFLARHPARRADLGRLLGRMARPVAADATFVDRSDLRPAGRHRDDEGGGFGALFEAGRRRDTVALWLAFFLCLLAVYTAFSWLPTMLTAEGLDVSAAGAGLTAYNLGGVFGALLCALAITRFGSRGPLVACAAGGAASAFFLRHVDVSHTATLVTGLALHGFFVNAVQSTMYAVCAYVYPTRIRATGTASALAFGRIGAIVSAFAGSAIIGAGGASAFFGLLLAAMAGAAVALMVVAHHIPHPDRVP